MTTTYSTNIETKYGDFDVSYFQDGDNVCVCFVKGDVKKENTLVRVHSSCLFSESFGVDFCDCKLQLSEAMRLMNSEGRGVFLYLYQEGRGLGLENKIRALELENHQGLNTYEAYKALHFEVDPREYTLAIKAMDELQVNKKIRLITNNPRKIAQLKEHGYEVERVEAKYPVNDKIKAYLKVKRDKLGHQISDDLIK